MRKRILSMFLGVAILITSSISCLAAPTDEVKNNTEEHFIVVNIPNDFEWDYDWRTTVKARYKETKEPITLSIVYDGRVYATIPKEKANMEIEPFAAEEINFTDYDGKYYEFSPIRELSKTGVIKGNEKGEALPFENITRAEATAMLMRFLGLENVPEANEIVHFEDVSKNDWYMNLSGEIEREQISLEDTIRELKRNVKLITAKKKEKESAVTTYKELGKIKKIDRDVVDRFIEKIIISKEGRVEIKWNFENIFSE